MKKIHLCCGDIYLLGYENCDIYGEKMQCLGPSSAQINPNVTTIDKYFTRPFEPDARKRPPKSIMVDTTMNILEMWPWEMESVDEIVLVNAIEHFEHVSEVSHIINQASRVLKTGGVFKFDFPDIKEIVAKYHDSEPEYCMNLLYGTHKNKYSIHQWGYTKNTVLFYLNDNLHLWKTEFKDVVKHDYPSQGVWATKT